MADLTCEKCIFYKTIDSGYGYCRRYPPVPVEVSSRRLLLFRQKVLRSFWPIVAWCRVVCGEFDTEAVSKVRVV